MKATSPERLATRGATIPPSLCPISPIFRIFRSFFKKRTAASTSPAKSSVVAVSKFPVDCPTPRSSKRNTRSLPGEIVGKHEKRLVCHQFLIPVLRPATGNQHDHRVMLALFPAKSTYPPGHTRFRVFKGHFHPVWIGRFRFLWT